MNNEYEKLFKISDMDITLATEELSELIKAIQKLKRYILKDKLLRDNLEDIIANLKEEIADVKIVMDRLIDVVFANDFEYYSYIVYKLNRVEEQYNNLNK